MKDTHKEKRLGNLWGMTGGNYAGNVYDKNYLAPTILTCSGGSREPMIITEYEDDEEN